MIGSQTTLKPIDSLPEGTQKRTMLLAYHPHLIDALRTPTASDPWRILVSGCLFGEACGVDGTDYGLGASLAEIIALPTVRALPFCPERFKLGVPRNTPDIHGGDGLDVVNGSARVLDEHGTDITQAMLDGGRAMVDLAKASDVEFAILTDASGACGSQVINEGSRFVEDRKRQKGVGVATAMLLGAGVHVISQRDFKTLGRLRARADASFVAPADARDHQDHEWTLANLPEPHPRA